jgi:fructose-1-phosphate kinase PfkB-like protein
LGISSGFNTLLVGLVGALQQALPLVDIARWGVVIETASAMRAGVSAGSRAEVAAVRSQVEVIDLGLGTP